MTNTTFDILAGRLSLDVSGFLRGLQTAGQAAERFVSNMTGFAASIKQSTAAVSGFSTAIGRSFQQAKDQFREFSADAGIQQWFGLGGGAAGRQFQPLMNRFAAPAMGGNNGLAGFWQRLLAAIGPGAGMGMALGGTQNVQSLLNQRQQAGDARGALDLQIQNIQARLAQSKFNLKQLSNEPVAGGGLGGFPGVDNSAYFLSLDTPLTREIKSLTDTLNQLLAQRQKLPAAGHPPPKLAAGGVVNRPTLAMVGDAGPEAVIPLSRLQQMFGNPANLFRSNQSGVMSQWLTQGGLARFDAAFQRASQSLTYALDHGITGAQALLDRWSSVQQTTENTLGFMDQRRRINLQPVGGTGGRYDRFATSSSVLGQLLHPAAAFAPQIAVHLHGVDVTNPANGRVIARAVYDHLVDETKRRGLDGLGRDPVRSFSQASRGPLTPAGFAQ